MIDIIASIFLILLASFFIWLKNPKRLEIVDAYYRRYIKMAINKAGTYTQLGKGMNVIKRAATTIKRKAYKRDKPVYFFLRAIIHPFKRELHDTTLSRESNDVNHKQTEPLFMGIVLVLVIAVSLFFSACGEKTVTTTVTTSTTVTASTTSAPTTSSSSTTIKPIELKYQTFLPANDLGCQ